MFDLKYLDKIRKERTICDNIDSLTNPYTMKKIIEETKKMKKKEVVNYISSILPSTNVVINNQMAYQKHGEKAFNLTRQEVYEIHKQFGFLRDRDLY